METKPRSESSLFGRKYEVDTDFLCALFQLVAAHEDLRNRTGMSGLPAVRGLREASDLIVMNVMDKDESKAVVDERGNRHVPVTIRPEFAAYLADWTRETTERAVAELEKFDVVEVPTTQESREFAPGH